MGLKGFQMDQVRVSPLHANFMENRGGADHSSMVKAITFVKEELKLQFGVDFETEVKFWDNDKNIRHWKLQSKSKNNIIHSLDSIHAFKSPEYNVTPMMSSFAVGCNTTTLTG